jgi:transcriptional regulator with XRE-family HTH domain
MGNENNSLEGNDDMTNDFGNALRALRQTLGLSQLALANRLGSTQRHLSFLETGRSRVTEGFLQRLCSELNLSAAQRGALFDATNLRNPYPDRALDDAQITEALDTIKHRLLDNWPFPAFALDRDWTILRSNTGAVRMFAGFGLDLQDQRQSLLTLVLSPAFIDSIRNWEAVSLGFYFRLQAAAERNTEVHAAFEAARASGLFDDIPTRITDTRPEAPMTCVELALPDGALLRMTPFVGQFATIQDTRLETIEIELMIPLDDATETRLRTISS